MVKLTLFERHYLFIRVREILRKAAVYGGRGFYREHAI